LLNSVKMLGAVAVAAFAGTAAASVTVAGPHGHTTFSGQYPHVVHVPAVPEADTWAMMAVGLGLVGLRLRRKSKNVA
jgi:hypothetical protein